MLESTLLTFLIAMVPIVELRGAIPFGVARGLPLALAAAAAVCGNLLPVPFIVRFIRRIFAWLRRVNGKFDGLVRSMEQRAEKKKDVVLRYAFWGLVVLVAIPLPGTGAWTGALVAAMMDMRLKRAVPAITVGVLIAAVIVSALTLGARTVIS